MRHDGFYCLRSARRADDIPGPMVVVPGGNIVANQSVHLGPDHGATHSHRYVSVFS